ncbi:hypothetical protein J2Z44_004237 [Clostridium punense]|uniref:Uncharacterized protein n=1 Tax=Clostridium punense TaxID=1054297 RepID=A0ABS4K9B7_9CLOT|nr:MULTISPECIES: hypothetical protein [Clostridium]EQB85825.1 hypothetical protein M918_17470 [Clostridium sp. BL8]MBP2024369.1 hypothetical protein [Clostridium punense]
MKPLKYGIIGGIFSLLLFIFLAMIIRPKATSIGDMVMIGTIVLSTIVCVCTGRIIEELNNKK